MTVQPLLADSRVPKTEEDFTGFATEEPYLMTSIIVIASRLSTTPSAHRIHEQSWDLMKVSIHPVDCNSTVP